MDQDTALELVKKGATLLLLDVPLHTLVGIDTQMYSVGPLFKGIKMIPPGTHFVHYRAANRMGNEFSPVLGFFITLLPSQVVVRKWHQHEEKLVKLSEEEEGRYSEAVKCLEFDAHLGPYAVDKFTEWKQISNYITNNTIGRIEPIGGEITIAFESGVNEATPKTTLEQNLVNQLRRRKFSDSVENPKTRCYYTPIPNIIKRKGISSEELTALNLDKTEILEFILLEKFDGAEDLFMGEMQFSFIAFLLGQSLEAFYQWKALVDLVLSCVKAPLHTRSKFFVKFIRVLYYQLKHGSHNDEGNTGIGISLLLDNSLVSKGSFLHHMCKDFFCLIEESRGVDGDLLSWSRKLRRLLETVFGLDFRDSMEDAIDEGDEFAPVIIYTSDEGAPEDQIAA